MLGVQTEDGRADWLLMGASAGRNEQALMRWKASDPIVGNFTGDDYRRLQLEYWIWQHRESLTGRVLDIGVYDRRAWVGDGYTTVGLAPPSVDRPESLMPPYPTPDVIGDLLDLPFADGSVDAVIATEVLEHVTDPFTAVRQIHRVLKPDGLALVSSPFLWPDHGIPGEFNDYFRILADGWRLLFKDFTSVKLVQPDWTVEGAFFYDQLRRWEGWGFAQDVRGNTGYFVEGVK